MKIFDSRNGWSSKVNFVDENNLVVGYDMSQGCCEVANWYIADQVTNRDPEKSYEEGAFEGFVFDPDFFEDVDGNYDAGGCVAFKLVKENANPLYLHIYNSHNGYYGHGFSFQILEGEEVIRTIKDGVL